MKFYLKFKYFHSRKCVENVFCEMVAILPRWRWVNWPMILISSEKEIKTLTFLANYITLAKQWICRHMSVMLPWFLAATKQLYEWFSPSVCLSVRLSVCPSVRPSVCHTFLTMFPSSYHHEIFRSYYQWQKWRPCKGSRSEVKGQGHRGHNPT